MDYAGIAYYLHKKAGIGFAEALGTLLYISFLDVYESVLFSSLGLLLYSPRAGPLTKLASAMRFSYLVMWGFLFAVTALSAVARRSAGVRLWAESGRFGVIAKAFVKATALDYLVVAAVKTVGFITALAAQYVTLGMFGIAIPFLKLTTFLPLVYLAAALPIAFANLGTGQAAWLVSLTGAGDALAATRNSVICSSSGAAGSNAVADFGSGTIAKCRRDLGPTMVSPRRGVGGDYANGLAATVSASTAHR